MKRGERVGAIKSTEGNTLYLYGYGVYDGDHHCEYIGVPNPRITLDNGQIVWGFECWWDDENRMVTRIEKKFAEFEVVMVDTPATALSKAHSGETE